jgi:phosphate/sulfate permease
MATIRAIVTAWIPTLPAAMLIAGGLYIVMRSLM